MLHNLVTWHLNLTKLFGLRHSWLRNTSHQENSSATDRIVNFLLNFCKLLLIKAVATEFFFNILHQWEGERGWESKLQFLFQIKWRHTKVKVMGFSTTTWVGTPTLLVLCFSCLVFCFRSYGTERWIHHHNINWDKYPVDGIIHKTTWLEQNFQNCFALVWIAFDT